MPCCSSAVFVVDAKHEKIAISESKCLGIPTFGIVDTNTDPNVVDFPIPANDDSIKTIKLILDYIADSLYNLSNLGKEDENSSISNDNEDSSEKVENDEVKENENATQESSDSK